MNEMELQVVSNTDEDFDMWAYVEIFGHTQLAGRVTTRKLGTQVMIQIDVPKADEGLSHSEIYGANSIFSIKPTTEAWCRRFAEYRSKHGFHEILPYIPPQRQLEEPEKKEPSDEPGSGDHIEFETEPEQ